MSRFQHQYVGPKPFTRPTYQGVNQMHIADGFVDDCDELLHQCSHFEPLTFEKFTEIWMNMNMGSFYYERPVGAEVAELSEEVIHIAKRYLVANTSKFEESVAGLFMVYCLLTLQPFKDFAALRLVPEDMPAIRRIELVARRDRRHDVLYILGQVLIKGPVQYHATNREYGFETTLRKYHEGSSNLDNYGVRPKGVFYRQNEELDIIKELQTCFTQYENIKDQLKDASGRPDPNLRFSNKDMATQLDTSLKRIINGLIQEEVKPSHSSDERVDRIREIKSRALNQAIDPIKHRTTVTDKKSTTVTSPQNKPDIVSKPGRVKSGSPMKPVTTGKRKQGKRWKRAAMKRRKKNATDFCDTSTDDEHNPDAEINLQQFQRVEVEIERVTENEEPNIEELVEKEFDIHIDTVPIVIKGNVEGNTSQKIEIEFIDQYQPPDSGSGPSQSNGKTLQGVEERINNLTDVSFTKVGEASEGDDEQISDDDLPLKPPSTDNLKNMLNKVVKTKYNEPSNKNDNNKFRLKKPERRELKKRHLKSKFKKMGLERLANFQESQKRKRN